MRTPKVAWLLALSLAACALGCGGGYPDPAMPAAEEDDVPLQPPPTEETDASPKPDDEHDADDPKSKGDPTDDLGDPAAQKHDDDSLSSPRHAASATAPRKS